MPPSTTYKNWLRSAERQRKIILLVEAHLQVAQLISSQLRSLGHRVISLRQASEAVNRLRSSYLEGSTEMVDLMILSLSLTQEEKREILLLVQRYADLTPIIVVSADYDEDEEMMYRRLGAADYLRRPFTLRQLLERCQALLSL